MKKRILSFLLALCLAAGLMPMSTTTAFAAGTNKSIMPGVSHLAPSDGSWDPTNDTRYISASSDLLPDGEAAPIQN